MLGDPFQPLRDDIRLLGGLLGDTLREHEGDTLFEAVEWVRARSKSARCGSAEDFRALERFLKQLPVAEALPIARAFAHFLTLANIAEQHHRIRRRREYQRAPSRPQRASFTEAFAQLRSQGVSAEALFAQVCDLELELVLTAHPTEVVRRTLRQKQRRVAELLAERDRPDLTSYENDEIVNALRREIASMWETDEVHHRRPTPLDEVRWGLVVFEHTLWSAVPSYVRLLDRALLRATGKTLPLDAAPIRFGSWMGGDRDGNPHVTPQVTRDACLLARWMAADLYLKEVTALRAELSMREGSAELHARIGNVREPYRVLLREVCDRLRCTVQWIELVLRGATTDESVARQVYSDTAQFAEPFDLCYRSLCETGLRVVAEGRLRDLLTRIACFGVTLVKLDLRQEAARHTEAIDAITTQMGKGSYEAWNEAERQTFLRTYIQDPAPIAGILSSDTEWSPEVRDVLGTFRTAASAVRESLGAYVISMATEPSDVLVVMLLQRAAGVQRLLRIVPLFEMVDDLRRAGDTMRALLAIPEYRTRINDRQEVMIGYSDSAKDGGRLAAAWDLYAAQERIVAECNDAGVRVTIFHGRGGTVGRGGGPTYLAIQSQPPGSVNGALRVTEQGEMIDSKFGLLGIAARTLEVYTTATLHATLAPSEDPPLAWRERAQKLADTSRAAYRGIVYEHADFVEYFRTATPEVELGELKIGSRPARRRAGTGVESLRAIPWNLAWTQTRLILPAWLGVGEALREAISEGALDELRAMYDQWPFFQATLDLIEMVLAKTSSDIAARYDSALVANRLRPLGAELRQRLDVTRDVITEVIGSDRLLDRNAMLRNSIAVRNPYVDPINLVQIEVLRRLRESDHPDDCLMEALWVTVNGIAAGMRNTG